MSFVRALLGPDGGLSQTFSGGWYEHRPEQLRMAEAAARALGCGGVLLVEAGTGTGKTLAYLAAAVDAAKRVIISTGTRTLQDQIIEHDIPLLEKALGRPLDAVCLKGQSNYLCLRKLNDAAQLSFVLGGEEEARLGQVRAWAQETETGDKAELTDLPENLPLWNEICSDPDSRLGPKCPFFDDCFVSNARRAAQKAQLVVINHHLYFADLALRESEAAILPDHDAVVFDEAHQIDAVATEFFGYRVSTRRIETLHRDARRSLLALRREGPALSNEEERLLAHLLEHTRSMFEALVPRAAFPGGASGKSELSLSEHLQGEAEASYWRLDSALEALSEHLLGLPTTDETIASCSRRCELIRADLTEILGTQPRASVLWRERAARSAAIGKSPVDVSELLRERLFFGLESVVLTSATLTAGGSFAYVRERLGIDFDVAELVLPSPFDYRRQAALYIPDDGPDPRDQGYSSEVARIVHDLLPLVQGGSLVLFTSYQTMQATQRHLIELGPDRRLLMQGERPRHALLEELRSQKEPMALLATGSFWQGVDLPGRALELVVIARLPFASPGDPIVAARLRHMTDEGRNPFQEYQVPQAALALKQGVGRLIRTRRDRGIVALLDSRVRTMSYGKIFVRSLPRCTTVTALEDLRRFWD